MTGKERTFGLDEFPTEQELIERYKIELNDGDGITEAEEFIMDQTILLGAKIHMILVIIREMQSIVH